MPNIPDNMTTVEKVRQLLSTQERLPANMQEIDKSQEENRAFLQHNSIEETQNEIDYIDNLLTAYTLDETEDKLSEADLMKLSNRQTLDYANILLNSNKKTDSDEMKDVKIDVLNLAKVMENCSSEPLSVEGFDKIEVAFEMAIRSCEYYIAHKNPWFSTGKERKRQVKELCSTLRYNYSMFTKQRNLLGPDHEDDRPATFADLMGMRGQTEEAIKRPEAKASDNQVQNEEPVDATKISPAAACFKSGYNFANAIETKLTNSKDVLSFYKTIKHFRPGCVALVDMNVLGHKVALLQKSDNSLYIVKDHKEYPLERSLPSMRIIIEDEIFSNPDVYGEKEVLNLLEEYSSDDYVQKMSSGENSRIRSMVPKFLAKRTKLTENDFINVFRKDMIDLAVKFIKKEKTARDIEDQIYQQQQNTIFVNGVAVSERAQLVGNMKSFEREKMLIMKKADKPEIIEEDWTEDEIQVKSMIADLIYTNDTENMDISLTSPGRFVNNMLEKHKEALKVLIKHKNDNDDFVKQILTKMSISDLTGQIGDNNVKLSEVITESINHLCDLKIEAGDKNISEEELIKVKSSLDEVVDKSCKILQANVGVMAEAIFPEIQQSDNRNKSIRQRVKEVSQSTHGQGQFMRNVFNTYFDKVSNIDKRAMLAAVFRSAQNVKPLEMSDNEAIDEIKESKNTKYPTLLNKNGKLDENKKNVYEVTQEEHVLLDEYRKNKQTLRVQANFLGGLIRGAGPLMHKMMQGLPTSSLPDEIKEAIKDVKENLPPIPDNLIQGELLSLVESSGGKLTKIEVEKSLGAASVGQALLCKVYGPAPELKKGKEVVIKLLRPEAKNRMQREEKIMLDAAHDTDEAMFLTYKGQLDNYKRELDLSVEAGNCKKGEINYAGNDAFNDVKTMTVLDGVPATATSLIVEKASGTTLDKYLKELEEYTDTLLNDYYDKKTRKDGSIEVDKNAIYADDPELRDKMVEKKKLILNKIDEAVIRRDHILNLCNIWIDKGLMDKSTRFYHGDLHSGNIMVDDNEATFIDYGNTVELSENQQKNLMKMALAASCSVIKEGNTPIELFLESFEELLKEDNNPEALALYTEQKKAALKSAFEEILRLGEQNEAGFRISLCIAKAQELGIVIPPALQNFSQGQIRLQNSIDEMNKTIKTMKKVVGLLESAGANAGSFDPVGVIQNKAASENDFVGEFKAQIKSILPADEQAFKTEILDNTVIVENKSKGIHGVNKREEFMRIYLGMYTKLLEEDKPNNEENTEEQDDGEDYHVVPAKELQKMGLSIEQIKDLGFKTEGLNPNEKTYRQMWEEFYERNKDRKGSEEHMKDVREKWSELMPMDTLMAQAMDAFGGYPAFDGIEDVCKDLDSKAMGKYLDIYEKEVGKAAFLVKKVKDFWNKLDNKKEQMTDEEKNQKISEIYADYSDLHSKYANQAALFNRVKANLDGANVEEQIEKDISTMFSIKEGGIGKQLKEKFDIYANYKKKYPAQYENRIKTWKIGENDKEAYTVAKQEFMDAYIAAASYRLKHYADEAFSKEVNIKYVDYDDCMEAAINKYFPHNSAMEKLKSGVSLGTWLGGKAAKMIAIG